MFYDPIYLKLGLYFECQRPSLLYINFKKISYPVTIFILFVFQNNRTENELCDQYTWECRTWILMLCFMNASVLQFLNNRSVSNNRKHEMWTLMKEDFRIQTHTKAGGQLDSPGSIMLRNFIRLPCMVTIAQLLTFACKCAA